MARPIADYCHQVALVTGAASGLGEELAHELAERGAVLVLGDIDLPRLEVVAQALRARGARVHAARLDVSDAAAFGALVASTLSQHGRLDLVVNNAGMGITGELRDLDETDWLRIRSVNLDGVVNGSMHAYRAMLAQRSGQIINIASMAAFFPYPLHTLYAATKHAVLGFSTTLRLEARAFGIRVNVVCPGPVDTPIFATTQLAGLDREKALATFRYRRLPPKAAAQIILERAARDEPIIVCPSRYRWLWRLARWAPWLMEPGLRKMVRDLRGCRLPGADP